MNSNGLILGVLGGMGPAASAEFMGLLAKKAPATCDQEHPCVILYSDTAIPNRTDYLMGKGVNPTSHLRDGLNRLLSWGADILAVTCNTSHFYIDSFPLEVRSRLVSIVDETILKAKSVSPIGSWLTATLGTVKTEVYQRHAEKHGYVFKVPHPALLEDIHKVTDLVKSNHIEESAVLFSKICKYLWDEDDLPIVCACTELPIAYNAAGLPQEKCVSSLEALADGCIRELYKKL